MRSALRGPAWQRVPSPLSAFPPGDLTLPKLLDWQAERGGDKPFVTAGGATRSARQMRNEVARWGAAFGAAGLQRGDLVAIMAGNCLETLDAILGASWAGLVPVTINTSARGHQLTHVLSDSGARLAVADAERAPILLEHLPVSSSIEQLWTTEPTGGLASDRISVAQVPLSADRIDAAPCGPADPLLIIYTSGTTGPAKGVICPHAQFFWWGVNTGASLGLQPGDVLHTSLPLFHTNALSTFLQAVIFDCEYSLSGRFSASRFWDEVSQRQATVAFLMGTMASILLRRPPEEARHPHRLRVALAPATTAEVHEEFEQRFGVELIQGYGSSETNHVIGAPPGEQRYGWMGPVLAGFHAAVVDGLDNQVPDGTVGELVLRSDEPFSFAAGYFGRAEQTVASRTNLWFHTGDQVVRSPDGWFKFVDRRSDSIRRRGENIAAFEVESAVLEHPGVVAVAAYGVPSDLGEDELMVSVVAAPGHVLEPLELLHHCQRRIAYFAVPRYVRVHDQLPLTETGKVQKSLLRVEGITTDTFDAVAAGFEPARPKA
ncbi:MAG TPA: AMP-binding protein [Mycobacterium sp.]|nr:AMP-binding protein [Mycobacterium sp.]